MQSLWRLSGGIVDMLYPPCCPSCRQVDSAARKDQICEACESRCSTIKAPFCGTCGTPFDGAVADHFTCGNCRDLSFAFDSARAPLRNDGPIRDMVHRFKYSGHRYLRLPLVSMMHGLIAELDEPERARLVVPVPLHPQRKRERGYNQSTQLARELSRHHPPLELAQLLRRTRMTETQTHLSRDQRLQNLKGAFALTRAGKRQVQGAHVLLIDDVLTTGATADACAQVLRHGGAREIIVLTAARG